VYSTAPPITATRVQSEARPAPSLAASRGAKSLPSAVPEKKMAKGRLAASPPGVRLVLHEIPDEGRIFPGRKPLPPVLDSPGPSRRH
jgi:hypothetical protein